MLAQKEIRLPSLAGNETIHAHCPLLRCWSRESPVLV